MKALWRWLRSLFRIAPKALAVGTPISQTQPNERDMLIAVDGTLSPVPSLALSLPALTNAFDRLFLEAAEKVSQAQIKEEEAIFLDNEKWRKLLSTAIETMVKDSINDTSINSDSISFIFPPSISVLKTFFLVLQGVCNPYEIKMEMHTDHIRVKTSSVRAAVDRLKLRQHIDIEERVRTMIHMGVYR
jgi:hypothetical protein